MKKQSLLFLSTVMAILVSAQGNNTLLRHDTTLLKADECRWLLKGTAAKNKSVPQAILETIQSGKLKAFDPQTNERIPGNKIFIWRQSADTTMVWDEAKKEYVIKVIQNKIDPERLTRIRVYHDWQLNMTTGNIESKPRMFELIGEVLSPSTGTFLGYLPLYRIYY